MGPKGLYTSFSLHQEFWFSFVSKLPGRRFLLLSLQPSSLLSAGECDCVTTNGEVGCLMPHNTLTGFISGAWWTHTWQDLLWLIAMPSYSEMEKNSRAITISHMAPETNNETENLSPLHYQITSELGVVSWPPWANLSLAFAKMFSIVILPLSMSSHPFCCASCKVCASGKLRTSGWST